MTWSAKRPDTHKGLPRDEFRQVRQQGKKLVMPEGRGGEATTGRKERDFWRENKNVFVSDIWFIETVPQIFGLPSSLLDGRKEIVW